MLTRLQGQLLIPVGLPYRNGAFNAFRYGVNMNQTPRLEQQQQPGGNQAPIPLIQPNGLNEGPFPARMPRQNLCEDLIADGRAMDVMGQGDGPPLAQILALQELEQLHRGGLFAPVVPQKEPAGTAATKPRVPKGQTGNATPSSQTAAPGSR